VLVLAVLVLAVLVSQLAVLVHGSMHSRILR
jgi:hypothetical protein